MNTVLFAIGMAVGLFAVPASTPLADPGRGVQILGDERFTPNAIVLATFHFSPGPLEVRSGEQVTWQNTTADPHTVSVVRHADLPATIDQLFACAICTVIGAAHFPNGFDQAPVPVLDDLKPTGFPPRLDSPGDSFLIGPSGSPGSSITAVVSAPAGTTLDYMCVIHPWMQGSIVVR